MEKTFNQKLQEAKAEFEGRETNKYGKTPMPEVVAYLRRYKETGKYPYNADVEAFILKSETVDPTLEDHLGTEVYLSQGFLRSEEQDQVAAKLRLDGFIPVKEIGEYTGPAHLIGTKQYDWINKKLNVEGKVIMLEDGPFFVPKGKRTRGYYLNNMESAFIKITK